MSDLNLAIIIRVEINLTLVSAMFVGPDCNYVTYINENIHSDSYHSSFNFVINAHVRCTEIEQK